MPEEMGELSVVMGSCAHMGTLRAHERRGEGAAALGTGGAPSPPSPSVIPAARSKGYPLPAPLPRAPGHPTPPSLKPFSWPLSDSQTTLRSLATIPSSTVGPLQAPGIPIPSRALLWSS